MLGISGYVIFITAVSLAVLALTQWPNTTVT
jgi:hypothetical protein